MSTSPSSEAASTAGTSPGDHLLAEDIPSGGATPSDPSSRPASTTVSIPAAPSNPSPPASLQSANAIATSHNVAPASSQVPSLTTGNPSHASINPNSKKLGDNTHHNNHSSQGNVSSDGRIRNPVPSKLLDSASEKDGNFAVMHMDVGKPVMDARSMAAKRTSEMTQAAAMQATRNGYQPVKRSKLVWNTSALEQRQYTPQPGPQANSYGATPPAPVPPPPSLSPVGVKAEQARLLTFLRSIHPVIVVDQLCKAIAYFGGIPGAPPPPSNVYPQSDKMNGSGALFVGWLSEIFPPADFSKPPFSTMSAPNSTDPINQANPVTNPVDTPNGGGQSSETRTQEQGQPQSEPPPASSNATATAQDPKTPKRPRGRPKGSKSTKVRSDKGIKKGYRVLSDGAPVSTHTSASNIDESVDSHGDSTHDSHVTSSQLTGTSVQAPRDSNQESHVMSSQFISTPAQAPGNASFNETPATGTPSGKKRGRPKGSKNKPKATAPPMVHDSSAIPPTGNQADASRVHTAGHGGTPADGLSRQAENWEDPPVQEPSDPSTQREDDQSSKRKNMAQMGESDHPPVWTNEQGQLVGPPQPQRGPEAQALQNKRPRLSQGSSQPTLVIQTNDPNGLAPASQEVSSSGSSQNLGNYDLSPKVGRMPVQPTPAQYQQPQSSQHQIPDQSSPNASFYKQGNTPSQSFSSRQSQQDSRERSSQPRQNFYAQQQQQSQQRAQQYQQFQNQNQYGQLKVAPDVMEVSQANNASPESSPTESRRQNASAPPARIAASPPYPAAYNDPASFLTLEYAMSANRAVEQSQNAFASQPTQAQLEASLADSDMRERLYQAFGGRR